jgi:hypothetical protein
LRPARISQWRQTSFDVRYWHKADIPKNRPRPNRVSLFALECDRANGSYRAKRYRGRKFCLGGDFEVSIPYSAADTKKLKGRWPQKSHYGRTRLSSRIYSRLVRRPNMSTRKSACRAGRKQSRRFPHLGRRLCYVPANFKLFALASHTLATKQG